MRILAGLIFLLVPVLLPAQRETSHWFLSGTSNLVEPTGVTVGQPVPPNFGGSMPTSVSDANGNLLFACDGNWVVDRDLQRVPGSTAALGGGNGRVLAQKIPGTTQYYIFYTVSNNTSPVNSTWTLKYALIDMALNGGKGDLVSTNTNVATGLSPGYTLLQGKNTGDAWLITHRAGTNAFRSYRITAAGLSAASVTSSAGVRPTISEYNFRELKTSHDGTMVAGFSYIDVSGNFAETRQFVEVFNFDFPSGSLTHKIGTGPVLGSYFYMFHSLEFSPDNRLLYASFVSRIEGLQPCGYGSTTMYQFNLCYTDPVDFVRYAPIIVNQYVRCGTYNTYGKIQLGADKRIHMPFIGQLMSTIEFPNRIGTSADYVHGKYQVPVSNTARMVTPGFQHRDIEKAVINNIRYDGGCYPAPTSFHITNDEITRVEWDFGDGSSGGANTSSTLTPTHLFSGPGKYNVSATMYDNTNQLVGTVNELVEIRDPMKRILYDYPVDTSFCEGGSLDINLKVVNGIFVWFRKDANGNAYGHQLGDNITITESQKLYVEMRQNDCNGCLMVDSIDVTVLQRPPVALGADRNLCPGDSLQLSVTDPAASYLWSDGSTGMDLWVKTAGIYWVQGEYSNNGCPLRDSVTVTALRPVVFALPPDTVLCTAQTLLLEPGVALAGYSWQDGSTEPQFLVETAGEYKVTVSNSDGCSLTDSIQVDYVNADPINLGADSLLCQGESITLEAILPAATYLWSNGVTTNEILVNQTGTYWIRADNGVCVVTDTIALRFDIAPIFTIGADTVLCPGQQLVLSPGVSADQYTWQDGSTNMAFAVDAAGKYWVDLVSGGCSVNDTIVVSYFAGAPVSLGPDRRVCENVTVLLNAGNGFNDYLWNNGAVTSSITVAAPGTYSVTTSTIDGCVSKDTVALLPPYALPLVSLDQDPALCYNSFRTLDAGSGFSSYLWNDGTTSRSLKVSGIGTYSVTVTDNNGCQGKDTVVVNKILPLPAAYLPADVSLCQYESVILQPARQFSFYRWNTGATTRSVEVNQPATYTLQVTDASGCVGKDTIIVLPRDCMEGVYIPGAFTPNRDGVNDLFGPLVFGPVGQYRFSIFNRWGQVIFTSSNPAAAWDGTYKGIPQDAGVFMWTCTYQVPGQEVQNRKGQVLLVR